MTKDKLKIYSDTAIAEMAYEEARQALSDVVGELETGGATLEDSLKMWALSEKLADRCESILDVVSEELDAYEQAGEDSDDYEDEDDDADEDGDVDDE